MPSIGASIELYDRISAPMNKIVTALQSSVGAFQNLNNVVDTGFDASNIAKVQTNITMATKVANEFADSIANISEPYTWQTDNFEVFSNAGVERFKFEIQSVNDMMQTLHENQTKISSTTYR